jgi:DNA invertase Pin-like site-specific DNA recombinase
MSERIGYARVSATHQNLDSQIDMLKQAGCTRIFSDKISALKTERPGWSEMMSYIRPLDMIVITELSRMSRSTLHLLQTIQALEQEKIELVSLRENIDTTTATGRCFIALMGAVSQMERELKAERTAAGRAAAKARGRSGGRPRTDPQKLEQAAILYENSQQSAAEISTLFGFSRRTLFNYIRKQHEKTM